MQHKIEIFAKGRWFPQMFGSKWVAREAIAYQQTMEYKYGIPCKIITIWK